MAYTQSPLQTELSKQREASAGWPWRLMTFSLIVLLTVFAVYAGMRFGFEEAYLKRALSQEEANFAKTFKSVSQEEQKNVFDFYSQLSNIDLLLKKQAKVTPYLALIEERTLKSIVYSNMDFKTDDRAVIIRLDGKTLSYTAVTQQLELFRGAPGVTDVKLLGSRFTNSTDGLNFSIQVTLGR